jgi:hypothetical protein
MKPTPPPDSAPPLAPVARSQLSEEWIEKFDAQCTELLLKRARRYAAQRARDLGWQVQSAGAYDPDELVDNIVKDTLAGVLRWDPNVRDFDQYLFDAVRKRVTRQARRMTQYPHESIDAVDSTGRSPVMSAVEIQLRSEAPEATRETRARLSETITSLRKLGRNKPLVQRLLTAFECLATEEEDVMRRASLTSKQYHSARRQLARLVERLPSHLKPRGYLVPKGA